MRLEPGAICIGRFGGVARAAGHLPRSGQFPRAKVVNYCSLFDDLLLRCLTLVVTTIKKFSHLANRCVWPFRLSGILVNMVLLLQFFTLRFKYESCRSLGLWIRSATVMKHAGLPKRYFRENCHDGLKVLYFLLKVSYLRNQAFLIQYWSNIDPADESESQSI